MSRPDPPFRLREYHQTPFVSRGFGDDPDPEPYRARPRLRAAKEWLTVRLRGGRVGDPCCLKGSKRM